MVTSGYHIVTRLIPVNSSSGYFIPGNVSFAVCANVCMLVRWSFLKDGGRNASFFCWESVAVCAACELVTVLSVGYCVRHKNQYSTYCAVLSQVLAVEGQWCLPNVINCLWPSSFHMERAAVN